MLRSVCLCALCIAGAKHASDLTFCSWKVPLWWMRTPLLFRFSFTALSVLMIPRVWYGPDCRCSKALCVFCSRFLIEINKKIKNTVGACDEQGLWVVSAPFVHTSLQFVSLCEYALFRNCFGVYRHYAIKPTVVLSIEGQERVWEPCCKWLQG
jgi:hypothetical protein